MTEIDVHDGAKYGERSPVPRRQLASLPANQRSYSRMSSKGLIFGDDSPLRSPIPPYPRRRSVTFAINTKGDYREERPEYHTTYSASAPVSPIRERAVSPAPMSILKQHSSYGEDDNHYGNGPYSYRATQNEMKKIESKVMDNDEIGEDYGNGQYHKDNASTAAALTSHNYNNNNNNTSTASRSVSGGNASFSQHDTYTDANVKRVKTNKDNNVTHNMQNSITQFHNSSTAASTPLPHKVTREGRHTSMATLGEGATTATTRSVSTKETMQMGANKENELPTQSNVYPTLSSKANHSYHSFVHQSGSVNRNQDTTNHSSLHTRSSRRVSPIAATRRGRSASRQRLAQRRREAELQHSFYDDSFVEEFVLSTKAELEREEELRRLEEQQRASVLAEAELKRQRAEEEKLSAVEKAKRILTSKVQRRSFSLTPPRKDTSTPALESQASLHDHRMEQEYGEGYKTASHQEDFYEQRSNNHTGNDNLEESTCPPKSREMPRRSMSEHTRHVSHRSTCADDTHTTGKDMNNVLEDSDIMDNLSNDNAASETTRAKKSHKRRKLEKIVNQLLQRQRQSRSKRSVVVIDWEDVDSSLTSESFDKDNESDDNININNNTTDKINKADSVTNQSKHANVLRQASTTRIAQSKPHEVITDYNDHFDKRPDKVRSEKRHRSHSRSIVNEKITICAPSHDARATFKSHSRNHSMVPDLADDSALYGEINVNEEDDRPILLPRRRQRQLIPTRSLSHLTRGNDNKQEEEFEEKYEEEEEPYDKSYSTSNSSKSIVIKEPKESYSHVIYSRRNNNNGGGGRRKNVAFETDEDEERIMRQPPRITRSAHRSELPAKVHQDDLNVQETEDNFSMTSYANKSKEMKNKVFKRKNDSNTSNGRSRLTRKGPVASDLFAPHRECTKTQKNGNGRWRRNPGEQQQLQEQEEEEYYEEQVNNNDPMDDETIGNSNQMFNSNDANNQSSNDNSDNHTYVEGDNLLFGTNNISQRGRRASRTAGRSNTAHLSNNNNNNNNYVNDEDDNGDDGNSDDPMAVFFNAAFPSPSKFDEMMMQAGGLPETRYTRRRQRGGHQPSLILPSSISRRR